MKDQMLEAIREKLGDAVREPFPPLVTRDTTAVEVPRKANAVIGMRRSGKTYFLYQCLAERLARGSPRESLVYFNLEDERLAALRAADLGVVLDEYYRRFPAFRRATRVTWCFDEIQTVPGWERFVRRVLDTEAVEVFLSGSSARMLSRELATSMRGRAMETVVTPYSFREFLRARGDLNAPPTELADARARSRLSARLDEYLHVGGFPEAVALAQEAPRVRLLQGYVDAVLFRDVVERHGIANVSALRALVRQLLRNPASSLSVSKLYADFHSRGIAVSKESLLGLVEHLVDAFLIFTLPVAARSERRRQVNPRKVYLADHGLAVAFSPAAGLDHGHLLENAVACELARRSRDLAYVRTASGYEVDFLATDFEGREQLLQVVSETASLQTLEREARALYEAVREHPEAGGILLLERIPPELPPLPKGVRVVPVWQWLLG